MGGGGLDYYDTAMLLRLGPPTGPDSKHAEKVAEVKKEIAAAKAALDAIVDTPKGKE
jgi:hypothetical protein